MLHCCLRPAVELIKGFELLLLSAQPYRTLDVLCLWRHCRCQLASIYMVQIAVPRHAVSAALVMVDRASPSDLACCEQDDPSHSEEPQAGLHCHAEGGAQDL